MCVLMEDQPYPYNSHQVHLKNWGRVEDSITKSSWKLLSPVHINISIELWRSNGVNYLSLKCHMTSKPACALVFHDVRHWAGLNG